MLALVDQHILSKMTLWERVAYRAVLSVGYGFSLRPCEYLRDPSIDYDKRRHVSVDNSAIWFGEIAYRTDDALNWPPSEASSFHIHLAVRKNDAVGRTGAFVLPAN